MSAGDAEIGGLQRAGTLMAAGTLASRGTGFLRTAVMVYALGSHTSLANVYNVANVIPNVLYDLLLGGVLGGVLVPVLIQAKRDRDGGLEFIRSLLTVTVAVLGALSLIAIVAAPAIANLYGFKGTDHGAAVVFLRFFLPQILFYGLSAVTGAVLNSRGHFSAPMIVPVFTNLITIAAYVIFILLPGGTDAAHLTGTQTFVLGAGTTLGIAAMWIGLLPKLRAVGVTFKPTWALRHPGLRDAWALSGWVLGYAAVNQIGYLIITRLASGAGAFTSYSVGYQVLQLPHAIIAVSVITALQPRIAAASLDKRHSDARNDIARALRTLAALLAPAAALMIVLGPSFGIAAFAHGATAGSGGKLIGETIIAFGAGLLPFSVYQLMIRTFYSLKQTRTPFVINVIANVINVVIDIIAVAVVPKDRVAVWLAVGLSVSYVAAALISTVLLARRVGGLRGPWVRRIFARCTLGATIGASAGGAVCVVLAKIGLSESFGGSLARLVAGTVVTLGVYAAMTKRMRVKEVSRSIVPLIAILRGKLAPTTRGG